MDYNFEALVKRQREVVEKRLTSLTKKFLEECSQIMSVINDEFANEHYAEWKKVISDRLYDEVGMTAAKWHIMLHNNVQTLQQYIKGN